MPNTNNTLLYKWFDQVWNQGNQQAVKEMFDADGIAHGISDENGPKGPEGFETFYNGFKSQFSNVDITVEEYIKRGFESLMVSFGCTGGQHRSVYAADAMARHLRNKFKVKIELNHWVQDEKNWQNPLPEKK